MSEVVLTVSELNVAIAGAPVLGGISFEVQRDGVVALVGEAGAGKTLAALTILGLTRGPRATIGGEVQFAGRELVALPETVLREIRGEGVGLAFQDPLSSLHPCYRLGDQVAEAVRTHHPVGRMAARDRAVDLIEAVGVQEPHLIAEHYPHELSAVEARRGTLAIALANGPQLLIADEPTGGLDEHQAAEIESLLGQLRCAVLVATRDRALAARLADEMLTLEGGRITERLRQHRPTVERERQPAQVERSRARRGGLLGRWRGRRR